MNKGIFIPIEVIENRNLSLTDKVVYAIYKYFTDNGNGCFLSAKRLGEELGVSESTVKRSKRNLKDLGFIETKRGRRSSTLSYHNPISDPIVDSISNTPKQTVNEEDKSVLEVTPDPISDPISEPLEEDNKELGQNDLLIGSNCTSKLGQNDPVLNKEVNKDSNKESFSISTYKGDDDKCSSSCLAEEPSLPDTSSALDEREVRRLKKLEELREALKKYIPEGWQRSDVISMAKRLGWESDSVLEILVRCYFYNTIPLQPLLAYYKEHPQDEVSMKIYRVVKDRDLDKYTQFCTLLDTKGRATNTNNE